MFTVKHYCDTADLLKELDVDEETREALMLLFEGFFLNDSPRFNIDRWRRRCNGRTVDTVSR
jgi:hypothetical protein